MLRAGLAGALRLALGAARVALAGGKGGELQPVGGGAGGRPGRRLRPFRAERARGSVRHGARRRGGLGRLREVAPGGARDPEDEQVQQDEEKDLETEEDGV